MPVRQYGKSSVKLLSSAVVALFALISNGCRGYQSSCTGADCSAAQTASGGGEAASSGAESGGSASAGDSNDVGEAGSSPIALGGAGDGGAAPMTVAPECTSDVDCDDGATCSGSERCVQGACIAGKPVVCGPNLRCVERGTSNACELIEQGPWLSFYQGVPNVMGIGLFGISTPYAASVAPIDLSQGIIDADGKILWDHQWSADGRYLVLNVVGEEKALYWVEFQRGMPTIPKLIPDVPQGLNQLSLLPFAKDTSSLLATSDELLIDIRFDADGPHASTVTKVPNGISEAAYCAGAKVVVVDNSLIQLDSPSAKPRLIAASVLSPNARRLLTTAKAGFEWQDCSLTGKPHPFTLPLANAEAERTLAWAPDSRHVLVRDSADSELELSLVDLDAPDPKTALLWQGSALDPDNFEASFSPDSSYLLLADSGAWSLVDVESGLEVAIDEPDGASQVSWAGDANSLLFQRSLSDSESAAWWLAKPNTAAKVIHSSSDPSLRLFVQVEDGTALALTDEGEGTQISRVDLKHPELSRRKLLAKPITGDVSSIEFAPDGTGVAFERTLLGQTDTYWLSLVPGAEGALVRLSNTDSLFGDFQPWQR